MTQGSLVDQSRTLRIGIACFATYGGSGVVAAELGRELARMGHRVHFISNRLPFRLQQGEFFENIYHHEVESVVYDTLVQNLYGLEAASKIIQIAVDEKLDLIHAHYAVPHAISAIVAKQVLLPRQLKIVTTLHGTDITLVGRAPSFYPLTKWAIEHSDAVTCVSDWLRQRTCQEFQLCNGIEVVHNFVDTTRFAPDKSALHRARFAKDDEKIILHISNFRPVKRLPDVLETFERVSRQMSARLLVIGDGPERERSFDLARKLNIMNKTWFLGKQDMIEHYFGIADLLLFPSEHESFGLAALEAMSSQVPVVATQNSGLSEVVEDGVTGHLCPVGDIDALTTACLDILMNQEKATEMGRTGRERALHLFQPAQIAKKYLDVYSAVLQKAT